MLPIARSRIVELGYRSADGQSLHSMLSCPRNQNVSCGFVNRESKTSRYCAKEVTRFFNTRQYGALAASRLCAPESIKSLFINAPTAALVSCAAAHQTAAEGSSWQQRKTSGLDF